MSKASEKVYSDLDKYLAAMKGVGKTPTKLYLSSRQFEDLRASQKTPPGKFKPTYRGFDIVEVK